MIRCRRRAGNADTCEGTDVAAGTGVRVRVLEARFHPTSRSNPAFVVVGRVLCDGARATIERADVPAAKVRPFDALRLYEKLEFLVMSMIGDPARGLLQLRSGFWSFVETSDPAGG
jgi:hypothetical protein